MEAEEDRDANTRTSTTPQSFLCSLLGTLQINRQGEDWADVVRQSSGGVNYLVQFVNYYVSKAFMSLFIYFFALCLGGFTGE